MADPTYRISDIIWPKAGQYGLTLFRRRDIDALESQLFGKRSVAITDDAPDSATRRARQAHPSDAFRIDFLPAKSRDPSKPQC